MTFTVCFTVPGEPIGKGRPRLSTRGAGAGAELAIAPRAARMKPPLPFGGVIQVALPYPPSANRLWRAVKGRNIKSAEYRAWLLDAVRAARGATGQSITGPYCLVIVVDRPDRRRRDLGNIEKPISDALVAAGLVRDDSDCQRITLYWSDRVPGPGARVRCALVRSLAERCEAVTGWQVAA